MAINKDGSFTNPFKSNTNTSSTAFNNPTDALKNDPLVGSAVMGSSTSSTSSKPKTKIGEFFSNPDNVNSIFGYANNALQFGTNVANTIRDQKALTEQVGKGTYQVGVYGSNTVGGATDGGANQGGGYTPPPTDNKILGMEKPIFFGLVGTAILLVGVGIFYATKGNGASGAPTATA